MVKIPSITLEIFPDFLDRQFLDVRQESNGRRKYTRKEFLERP